MDLIRNHGDALIIIYDVLGHFPHPRDHLSIELSKNFNKRSKNGFLFSHENDIVLTACEPDPDFLKWLNQNDFAKGKCFLFNFNVNEERKSFFEELLSRPQELKRIDSFIKNEKLRIFSWMNSTSEQKLSSMFNLKMAWKTPQEILDEQFDKESFKERIKYLDLPCALSFVCSTLYNKMDTYFFQQEVNKINRNGYLVAKPANGAAGSGIFKFAACKSIEAANQLNSLPPNRWLIEEFVDQAQSINLQIFINNNGEKFILGYSEQVFDGFLYRGNKSTDTLNESALQEMLRQSEIVADDLFSRGYSGLIGLDFLVNGHDTYLVENNIRINGSTFSLLLILEVKNFLKKDIAWRFEKFNCNEALPFKDVQKKWHDLLYVNGSVKDYGVFIQEYNQDSDQTEMAVTYWATNNQLLLELKSELEKRLNYGKNYYQ